MAGIDRITLALAKKYTDEHGGGGTSNYNSLSNKPKINSVELSGNKSLSDLGVPLDTDDLTNGAGFITANDIPADVSAFNNDAGYITKSVNDLTNYTTTANMNTALGLKQNVILASALPIGGTTQTTVEGALGALNTAKIDTSDKGVAGGLAELDNTGKVPSSQLPSYVDDVVDGYYNTIDGKFYEESTYTTEIAGEAGKIYISVDTDLQYRWTGSAFAAMGGALVLGETSSTAYRGDRGKTAYDDSQTNKANIGTMANLTTTEKGSLVGAINEVAASSGGGSMNFSTTEKIVGTWIDGKPIYQITVHKTNVSYSASTRTTVSLLSGIDTLVNCYGNAGSYVFPFALVYNTNTANTTQLSLMTQLDGDVCKLLINRNGSASSFDNVYATILYTKTTD